MSRPVISTINKYRAWHKTLCSHLLIKIKAVQWLLTLSWGLTFGSTPTIISWDIFGTSWITVSMSDKKITIYKLFCYRNWKHTTFCLQALKVMLLRDQQIPFVWNPTICKCKSLGENIFQKLQIPVEYFVHHLSVE